MMVDPAAAQSSTPAASGSAKIPVILQVVTGLKAGYAARLAIDTAIAVARAGGRALVASRGGNHQHELDRAGVRHVALPVDSESDFKGMTIRRRLRRLIDEESINIVHAHGWGTAYAARMAIRGRPVRLVTSYLQPVEPLGFWQRRRLRALVRADRVVAPAQIVAAYLRTQFHVDPARIAVVPPGVNLARFSPASVRAERIIRLAQQWRVPDDRRIVLVAAPLAPERGQTQVIEAIARLELRDIYCLLVGARPEQQARREELEKLIAKRDLGGVVLIADHCSDMAAAYMLADTVVAMERLPRGYSRVVLEAQAMGRPVIASSVGGVAESLLQGETGWSVPPDDVAALTAALRNSLSLDAVARARLAAAAMDHMRRDFSLDSVNEQMLALYDGVLEGAWRDTSG